MLTTNLSLQAVFAEVLATTHPTPYCWLASYGFTNNLESPVNLIGANGLPLWQSYLAGLNPNDPNNRPRLSLARGLNGIPDVLTWNTSTGHVYTLWYTTNLTSGFVHVPGASNLLPAVRTYTHALNPPPRAVFCRLEAGKL